MRAEVRKWTDREAIPVPGGPHGAQAAPWRCAAGSHTVVTSPSGAVEVSRGEFPFFPGRGFYLLREPLQARPNPGPLPGSAPAPGQVSIGGQGAQPGVLDGCPDREVVQALEVVAAQ